MAGVGDAGRGSADGAAVLLCRSRVESSRGPPVAGDPRLGERGADGPVGRLRRALFARRPAEHRAGAAAAGDVAAMLLLGALGAAADGAAGVRPLVPLVRRARGRRPGVGRERVLEEPRPAARGRGGAALPGGARGLAGGEAAVVERALLGGRHADPGLGQPEELPAQGRRRRSARAGAQRRAELQGREALERDPCQHHRPGRAPLPQGQRPAGGALLHRARADGEPQRADGGRGGDAGDRRRRAAGGDRARQGRGRRAADHARRRQGLRHGELRAGMPRGERHAARGAKHHRDPRLAHRRAAPPGTPATRSPCASASGSRRASAGSRRSRGSPRSSCAAWPASTSPSSSASPPTTCCGCRSCWRRRREPAGGVCPKCTPEPGCEHEPRRNARSDGPQDPPPRLEGALQTATARSHRTILQQPASLTAS